MFPSLTRVAVVALIGATATARTVLGQGADPMGHLVAEALRANLSLEQQRLAERRSAAGVREARGQFLPSLTLDSRYTRLDGVPNLGDFVNPAYAALNQLTGTSQFPTDLDITLPQQHETRLRLVQPLFNAGILANHGVARGRHDAQRMQLAAAARRLAADVQAAWLNQASARRVVEILEATLALVVENERVAARLLAAGRATPEAQLRARAERSDVAQQLDEARERRTAAARALNQLLRRPLDAPVEVIPDSALELPLAIDADSAVAHALAAREELSQVDVGVRTGRAAVRGATSAFLPALSLALDYGFQGPDPRFGADQDFWMASLVLSWNVFNGGRDAARRAAALIQVEETETLRADLEERIALEVRSAHEAAVVARAAIATADDRLATARRTFELVRRRYEEGVATPIEFVDARTALTSAELNRVLTAYRYALRWVDLERASARRALSF